MAELTENTLVRHPKTGTAVLLVAGGQLPDWATDLVGDHLLTQGAAQPAEAEPDPAPDQDGPPPKGGAGSGAPAWREYAARNNVEVAEDASREDVVAALDAAGVRTE